MLYCLVVFHVSLFNLTLCYRVQGLDLHVIFPTGLLGLLFFPPVMHGMYIPICLLCSCDATCVCKVRMSYMRCACGVHDCRKSCTLDWLCCLYFLQCLLCDSCVCVCICEVRSEPSLQCLYCMSCVCVWLKSATLVNSVYVWAWAVWLILAISVSWKGSTRFDFSCRNLLLQLQLAWVLIQSLRSCPCWWQGQGYLLLDVETNRY